MSQRFSDAELAAEYWRAMYQYRVAENLITAFGSTVGVVLREHEAETLRRFATLPHAHPEYPGLAACTCTHLIGGHRNETGHCEVITCGCPLYDEQ